MSIEKASELQEGGLPGSARSDADPAAAEGQPTWSAEWATGWRIVVAGALGVGAISSRYYTVGLFMKPLQDALGWSRGEISSALTVYSLVAVVTAPLYGRLMDIVGSRRVALFGVPAANLAFAALSLVGPKIWTWYIGWLCIALVGEAAGSIVWMTGISKQFDKQRGLAIAVANAANGVTAAIMPPLSLFLIEHVGWRETYLIIGVGLFSILFPATWFLYHEYGAAGKIQSAEPTRLSGVSLGEAVRNWRFWSINFTMLVVAAVVGVILVHLVPMLTDAGLSRGAATTAMVLIGPSLVVGRLTTGVLLDRIPAPLVACVACILPLVGCVLLLNIAHTRQFAPLIAVIFGLATGAENDIVAYLTGRYFGRKNFSTIFGVTFGFFDVGVGAAPGLAGVIFDLTGSYQVVLVGLIIALAIAAVVILNLGPYPRFDEPARTMAADPA